MRWMDLKKATIYKHPIATSFGICRPYYWPHGSTCNDTAIGFPTQKTTGPTGEHLQGQQPEEILANTQRTEQKGSPLLQIVLSSESLLSLRQLLKVSGTSQKFIIKSTVKCPHHSVQANQLLFLSTALRPLRVTLVLTDSCFSAHPSQPRHISGWLPWPIWLLQKQACMKNFYCLLPSLLLYEIGNPNSIMAPKQTLLVDSRGERKHFLPRHQAEYPQLLKQWAAALCAVLHLYMVVRKDLMQPWKTNSKSNA